MSYNRKVMSIVVIMVVSLIATALSLFVIQTLSSNQKVVDDGYTTTESVVIDTASGPTVAQKRIPAPTTVAGYQKMFDSISADKWLSADVSLSVQMPGKNRVVWLYGDTMSRNNGFVNSTAIVQTGGRVHVSRGGKQLLPEGVSKIKNRRAVYWIEAAQLISKTRLKVSAVRISAGTDGIWDFYRTHKKNREAVIRVDKNNNVWFVKWRGWVKAYDGFRDLSSPEPGLLQYERRAHPWATLNSGKCLMTVNNVWTKKRPNVDPWDTKEFGPTYYAGDGIEHHISGDVAFGPCS